MANSSSCRHCACAAWASASLPAGWHLTSMSIQPQTSALDLCSHLLLMHTRTQSRSGAWGDRVSPSVVSLASVSAPDLQVFSPHSLCPRSSSVFYALTQRLPTLWLSGCTLTPPQLLKVLQLLGVLLQLFVEDDVDDDDDGLPVL